MVNRLALIVAGALAVACGKNDATDAPPNAVSAVSAAVGVALAPATSGGTTAVEPAASGGTQVPGEDGHGHHDRRPGGGEHEHRHP